MPSPSAIRAYVDWRKSAVFAGEEVECVITFTNITPVPIREGHEAVASQTYERSSKYQESHGANTVKIKSQTPLAQKLHKANHRQNLSLNLTKSNINGSSSKQEMDVPVRGDKGGYKHERSLSITSIGIGSEKGVRSTMTGHTPDFRKNHGRSASLQIVSWGSGGMLSSPSHVDMLPGK